MSHTSTDGSNRSPVAGNAGTQGEAWSQLLDGFQRLIDGDGGGGTYAFLLLRESPVDHTLIDGDDVDLLGTRDSIEAFIRHARALSSIGKFNFRVVARLPTKVQLTLYSVDGKHNIRFDLWSKIWQIDGGKYAITYDHCESLLIDPAKAIGRLPAHLEACLYIQHVVSKRKKVGSESFDRRLNYYLEQCIKSGSEKVLELLKNIQRDQQISDQILADLQQVLQSELEVPLQRQTILQRGAHYAGKLKSVVLGSPRRPKLVSIMGCDGSGKTTLAKSVKARESDIEGVFTGKHLYRKSWFFKVLVILVRPLLLSTRERFDEKMALFAYLRAALALRLMGWRKALSNNSKITLIDRTLGDFLYVNRKTDTPRFCRGKWISEFTGQRFPVVHLVVDYQTLAGRKQEFTETGHTIYDTDMFEFHAMRVPTDYTLFGNTQPAEQSAESLAHILGLNTTDKVDVSDDAK